MIYRVLCIGRIKDDFYRMAIAETCSRINKGKNMIEIMEFPDEKIPGNLKETNKEQFLERECCKLESKISGRDYVVALCIEGKELTTKQHKEYVRRAAENGYRSVTYIIGGSLGLPKRVKERADLKFSFSKMTFPHQMMRMVLCEEIENLL